jgi:uncharacterized membrane protein
VGAWRAVRPHSQSTHTTAPDEAGTLSRPLVVLVSLSSIALLAGPAVVLGLNYDALPERYPMHYGLSGAADSFVGKSPGAVFAPLLIGAGVLLLLLFMAYRVAGRANKLAALGTSFLLAVLFAYISLAPLVGPGNRLPGPPWLIFVILLVAVGGAVLSLGWAQSRPGATGDGTPDDCWKWGMVYVNPADPAIVVQKRSGLGWTLNFGRRTTWIIMAILIACTVLPLLLSKG